MGWPRRARLFEVVAESPIREFPWHENTTLLPPVSGAVDAGAEAPDTALHDGRKIAGVEWMVRVVINTSDFKVCGEDNTQFANLLHT